jgi:hypothetical protein
VGLECFPASQGWAWDRHKIGGRLTPLAEVPCVEIRGVQVYRFHCELCGVDAPVTGLDAGPHGVVRMLQQLEPESGVWRYSITKQGLSAWMDVDEEGRYLNDSAGIGFGPWPEQG